VAALLGATGGASIVAKADPLIIGSGIYESIGVRPLVNCRGTFTIISGSLSLPEVKRAMEEAGHHYVDMDELMLGVSKRLAEITGAEWGIVTAGCAAALTHITSACLAGTDPEKMQRLPKLEGLKSEVVIPAYSRNDYDHAIRMLGVKMVEVKDPSELETAFNEHTALAYILAGHGDEGPLGTQAVSNTAKKWGVPVVVDAAAEMLTIPNIHLQRGASIVTYSGGKCLRGPQCAGVALGDKNILQAAWLNSAPHHAFGRSLKVGKEEIMGMLTAVEMWTKRDHKAEWDQWQSWLDHISSRVTKVDGVTTRVVQPDSLSNHAPVLVIEWDGAKLGITGQEAAKVLFDGEQRITFASSSGSRPRHMASSISVMPYMMMPGDEKIAAEHLYAVLSKPPKFENPSEPGGEPANIDGLWDVKMQFKRGSAIHAFSFEQKGEALAGAHRMEWITGDLRGFVTGNRVEFRSSSHYEGKQLSYHFEGTVSGSSIEGEVNLGEYGSAHWTAQKHQYS
jgi:L-seryl-tRNA(Ser) seleniumtransferase